MKIAKFCVCLILLFFGLLATFIQVDHGALSAKTAILSGVIGCFIPLLARMVSIALFYRKVLGSLPEIRVILRITLDRFDQLEVRSAHHMGRWYGIFKSEIFY